MTNIYYSESLKSGFLYVASSIVLYYCLDYCTFFLLFFFFLCFLFSSKQKFDVLCLSFFFLLSSIFRLLLLHVL